MLTLIFRSQFSHGLDIVIMSIIMAAKRAPLGRWPKVALLSAVRDRSA